MLSIVLNINSILIHMKSFPDKILPNNVFSISLAFVDSLLGMYLLIISSANWYYKRYYVSAEYSWKISITCKTSALVALISIITSPVILFVIMLSRFCVVQWPMTSKFKNIVFSLRLVLTTLVITILTCVLIITYFFATNDNNVPSGICFLLCTDKQQSFFLTLISLTIVSFQMLCSVSN